jgi:PiT family inorganic phosphate transporter
MTISFLDFLAKLIENPSFLFITILISAVILVNGWTDAPNTIATAISTRSIRPKRALLLAEICNFFGVLVMTLINAKVAQTIFNIVNFGDNAQHSQKFTILNMV